MVGGSARRCAGRAARLRGSRRSPGARCRRHRSPSRSIRSTARPTSTPMSRSAPSSRSCRLNGPHALLQPGISQLAAGFLVYGPQSALVLTSARARMSLLWTATPARFCSHRSGSSIPAETAEYAINASNYRHWDAPSAPMSTTACEGRGAARQGLQHALDRLAGGRSLPHPDPRRRLSLSGRRAHRATGTAGCAWSTRRTRSPS